MLISTSLVELLLGQLFGYLLDAILGMLMICVTIDANGLRSWLGSRRERKDVNVDVCLSYFGPKGGRDAQMCSGLCAGLLWL